MLLLRQGYCREMPHANESDPSIKDHLGKKVKDKSKICAYLRSGTVLAACGEVAMDVIKPENGVIGVPDDMTDGKLIWPSDLAYYVERYDLHLSPEFLDYMASQNWQIPKNWTLNLENLKVL